MKKVFITIIWLIIITLLRWDWGWYLILLWTGGILGIFLFQLDHLFYVLIVYPQQGTSLVIKKFIHQQKLKQAFQILRQTTAERIRLPFRNALFQVFLTFFCFWVLTSTNNWFGKALVMSLFLQLLKHQLTFLFNKKDESLRQQLFWLIKAPISFKAQKFFVIFGLISFVLLNLLLI